MARLEHRGVDVHVIDDVLRLVPPALCVGQVGIDMGREHAIVKVMIMVLGGHVRDPHGGEPLDHATANAAGQESSERSSMVWRQGLAILLEGKKDIALPIQSPAHVNGCSVRASLALRQLTKRALEVNETVLLGGPGDPELVQELAESHPCPHRVAHGSRTPVETNSLLGHVLLFASVSSTDEGHWDGHDSAPLARGQLVHAELAWVRHTCDLQFVV
mmetsp:Transcript_49636/g.89321  ORF Transcript_49636/g.89321 Transcript_49636/m.89321 type:complete len:217 (+) Transcript_49636:1695-2345(+)